MKAYVSVWVEYNTDFSVNISDVTESSQCDCMAQCLLQLIASQLVSHQTTSPCTKSRHVTVQHLLNPVNTFVFIFSRSILILFCDQCLPAFIADFGLVTFQRKLFVHV